MLELRRLSAGYGRAQVLFDVGLELRAGEAVRLRINPRGPRVVDPRQAMTIAARSGLFRGD